MPVTVQSVLILNSTQVRLNISPMQNGLTYQLDIDNVQDIDGITIDPAYPPKTFAGLGIAPQVVAMTYVDMNHLRVTFDMGMENNALLVWAPNYILTGPNAAAVTVVTRIDATTVELELDIDMIVGTYDIEVINVVNTAGTLIDAANDTAAYDLLSIGPFRNSPTLVSGLISHYAFDGNVLDSHTNHYDAVWDGTAANVVTGKIGDAYSFTGAGQHAYINHNTIYDNTTRISFSAWIYILSTSPAGQVYGLMGRRSNFGFYVINSDHLTYPFYLGAAIVINTGTTLTFESSEAVPRNQWTHVAFTFGSSYGNMYINGQSKGTKTTSGCDLVCYANPTEPISLGAVGRNYPSPPGLNYSIYRNTMDELAIWNRELTAAEITELYRGGVGLTY